MAAKHYAKVGRNLARQELIYFTIFGSVLANIGMMMIYQRYFILNVINQVVKLIGKRIEFIAFIID